jgi:hypothetical protein
MRWGAKAENQIDDLAVRESDPGTRDGADAKESIGTRKEDGDLIGPTGVSMYLRRRAPTGMEG